MKIILYFTLFLLPHVMQAQNVGIGIANPADKLQVHGGSSLSAATLYTNTATGASAANGMRVGIQYQAGNSANQYGFIQVPNTMAFRIFQDIHSRMELNANGNFGFNTTAYDPFSVTIGGSVLVFSKPNQEALIQLVDSTPFNGQGVGFIAQKNTPGGKNFSVLAFDPFLSKGALQFNFKNGQAAEKRTFMLFDSSGNTGIGSMYDANLQSKLHVFGDQRIEGAFGADLYLHSPSGNYTNGSAIHLQYTPFGKFSENFLDVDADYFIKLNDGDAPANIEQSFAIGRSYRQFGPSPAGEIVAMTFNKRSQLGLLCYPDITRTEIKVDINGNTRIAGGLQLSGIGEASGKLLVSNATGNATWQNPIKLTMDNPSATGLASMEWRTNNVYRGGFGYDGSAGRFFFYDGESNTNTLFINNGRMGIQRDATTNALEVNGNASKSAAGSWLGNSDARLKKDIYPIQSALNKLLQLNGITYQWNDDKTGNTRPDGIQMGFTAQNIQQVFPENVSTDAQGYLQTAYGTYDALLVEAIRELLQKVEALEKKIQAIEKKEK